MQPHAGFHATHAQCQLGALCRAPWGARGEWKWQRKASWPLPGRSGAVSPTTLAFPARGLFPSIGAARAGAHTPFC